LNVNVHLLRLKLLKEKQIIFGLISLRRDQLRTAQGESKFSIYQGKIILDDQEYEIPVCANNKLTETLLGSEWLKILPLSVNYQAGILTLGE
jgi:predicted aspartyl protease